MVIFIDSCFWHGCNKHLRMPNSNQKYWLEKISRNKIRDSNVNKFYKESGLGIIRIWEHEFKNIENVILKIKEIKY